MPKKVPLCPVCGEKLSYDSNPRPLSRGGVFRKRKCSCGYYREEEQPMYIMEYFPESAPIPYPQHPGEGGGGKSTIILK
jgi:hypothetical protein